MLTNNEDVKKRWKMYLSLNILLNGEVPRGAVQDILENVCLMNLISEKMVLEAVRAIEKKVVRLDAVPVESRQF